MSSKSKKVLRIAVGSTNAAKLRAADSAARLLFPENSVEILSVAADSGVRAQPLSASETISGAVRRASTSLSLSDGHADFGVGMEGGLELVDGRWFECGWMAVVDVTGKVGLGSTARAPVGPEILRRLLEKGEELGDVVDDMAGRKDVRTAEGYMGLITNGNLPRDQCYLHGLLFAFAPFVSERKFWE